MLVQTLQASTTSEWALIELIKNPKVIQKLRDELSKFIKGGTVRPSPFRRLKWYAKIGILAYHFVCIAQRVGYQNCHVTPHDGMNIVGDSHVSGRERNPTMYSPSWATGETARCSENRGRHQRWNKDRVIRMVVV